MLSIWNNFLLLENLGYENENLTKFQTKSHPQVYKLGDFINSKSLWLWQTSNLYPGILLKKKPLHSTVSSKFKMCYSSIKSCKKLILKWSVCGHFSSAGSSRGRFKCFSCKCNRFLEELVKCCLCSPKPLS